MITSETAKVQHVAFFDHHFTLLSLTLMLPTIAAAHPGHGTSDHGAMHWVEPIHSVPFAAILVLGVVYFVVRSWKLATQES